MHFAYTAPIALPHAPAFHLASLGELGPALAFLVFAAFVVATALTGSRATFRSLDGAHRGQIEPIIAKGGPVTAAIKAGRGPARCPRTGRFVKAA